MTRYLFLIVSLFFAIPASLVAQRTSSDTPTLAEILQLHDDHYFKEALPLWQKILPKYEQSKDTLGWVTCLWGIGDIMSRRDQYQQSDSFHRKAIALLERVPRQAGNDLWPRVYSDYAKNCLLLPDTATCFAAIQRAIKEAEPFWGRPQFFYGGDNYDNLGLYYERVRPNDTDLILQAYNKSIQAYEASGIGMERIFIVHLHLSEAYMYMNDVVKEQQEYALVSNWFENLPTKERVRGKERLYTYMGYFYVRMGQMSKAQDCYEKAEKYLIELYGPAPGRIARMSYNFAHLYLGSGRFAEALPWLDKGLEAADAAWSTPSDLHIVLKMLRVKSYVLLKNFPAAAADIEKLKVEIAQQKKDEHFYIPYLYYSQALYHERKGELAESLEYYQKILALLEKEVKDGQDTYTMRPALRSISDVLSEMGKPKEALPYAERALRLFLKNSTSATSELSLVNIPDSLFIWDFDLSYAVNTWLSALLQCKEPKALERAKTNSLRVIQINERFRRIRIGLDEQDFALWIEQLRNTYEIVSEINQAYYAKTKDPQFIAAQFQLCERFNSVKITESAVKVEAQSFAGISDPLLTELQRLQNDMTLRQNELAMLPQGVPAFDSLLHVWKIRRQTIVDDMEDRYPRYRQMRYEIPETNIADIQQALPDDGVFISYFIHKNRRRLDIFTIDKKEGLQVTHAPIDSALRDVVFDLHNMAQSVLLNRQATRERFINQSHAIYRQLLAPIAAQIADKKHLIIVPDDFLYYVPFEVLVKDPTQTTFQQADFLVKRATVSYHYSGRLYANTAAEKRKPLTEKNEKQLFAFAPVFEGQSGDKGMVNRRSLPNKEVTLRAFNERGEFVPLPYSEYEVKTIAQLFPSDQAVLSLRGGAQESTLKQALQSPYRIVHIASHSFTNLRYPKFSGIACIPETDTTKEGILYANEIYNLNAQADLVVLSSCESGIGKLNEDEGMLGLNRAFAYAGVPNVMYSLWKVSDKATSELMVAFYKEMLTGKTYAAALRAAKLKMLENPITASPNFWSGFLLMGR